MTKAGSDAAAHAVGLAVGSPWPWPSAPEGVEATEYRWDGVHVFTLHQPEVEQRFVDGMASGPASIALLRDSGMLVVAWRVGGGPWIDAVAHAGAPGAPAPPKPRQPAVLCVVETHSGTVVALRAVDLPRRAQRMLTDVLTELAAEQITAEEVERRAAALHERYATPAEVAENAEVVARIGGGPAG